MLVLRARAATSRWARRRPLREKQAASLPQPERAAHQNERGTADPPREMKVGLVASSGGHLLQLHQLKPWWEKHDRIWVTFDLPDAHSLLVGERVVWAHHPTTRNIPNLLRNVALAWRLLRAHRPDVVVSTGAAVAFPFFVVARLLRIKTVYVEVYDRIDLPTLTGRLCHPLSNLFLVQWEEQKRFYRRSQLLGRLL